MAALTKNEANRKRWQLMPPAWRAIAEGTAPLEDLTDEEVFKGRLLRSDGVLGPRPAFYPQNFIDEQIRRSLSWAQDEIRSGAREAIQVFKDIMMDTECAPAERLKAAMFFTDRFLGKEITRVMVTAEDPVESLFRQLLADPLGLVPHEASAEERALLQ